MDLRSEGITFLVPCLNEEQTIATVIHAARAALKNFTDNFEVLVVDNGSTDASVEVSRAAGARVEQCERRGYGAALDYGIRAAEHEIVVFADADGSYKIDAVCEVVKPLVEGHGELVIANRFHVDTARDAMPKLNRHLGTPVLSFVISVLNGFSIQDCNSGYRAVRRSRYLLNPCHAPGMEFASEMIIRFAEMGARIAEVKVQFFKDQRSRPPHLKRWLDGWRHLRLILAISRYQVVTSVIGIASVLSFVGAFVMLSPIFVPGRYHSAAALSGIASCLGFLFVMLMCYRALLGELGRGTPIWGRLRSFCLSVKPFLFGAMCLFAAFVAGCALVFEWSQRDFGALLAPSQAVGIFLLLSLGINIMSLDLIGLCVEMSESARREVSRSMASLSIRAPDRAAGKQRAYETVCSSGIAQS